MKTTDSHSTPPAKGHTATPLTDLWVEYLNVRNDSDCDPMNEEALRKYARVNSAFASAVKQSDAHSASLPQMVAFLTTFAADDLSKLTYDEIEEVIRGYQSNARELLAQYSAGQQSPKA